MGTGGGLGRGRGQGQGRDSAGSGTVAGDDQTDSDDLDSPLENRPAGSAGVGGAQ